MIKLTTKKSLSTIVGLLIIFGFLVTSFISYFVSANSAKSAMLKKELPLTSDNIYSEVQKDLLKPIVVSSLMAANTFLRDWMIEGEVDQDQIEKYLNEIKIRYNTISSFLVSEKTRNYYYSNGIMKKVSPENTRDVWYFRVRDMEPDYEINVDPDMANNDSITIFINYKVYDYNNKYIGATGVGLTVNNVKSLLKNYQERFGREVYFADRSGNIVLCSQSYSGPDNLSLRSALDPYLSSLLVGKNTIVEFKDNDETIFLSGRYIDELNWILLVEQKAGNILGEFKNSLNISIAICSLITLIVVFLTRHTVNYFNSELENMAMNDQLTGIPNRRSFFITYNQLIHQIKRDPEDVSALLIDIDYFKTVNDKHGHNMGDEIIKQISSAIRSRIRQWDFLCRWGGEEFLVLLKGADRNGAKQVAESIREGIEHTSFGTNKTQVKITVSIGLSQYIEGDTESVLVNRADKALYEAKKTGRNRVIIN